jgi:hypothetical protein
MPRDACGLVARWAAVFCVVAVTAAREILLIEKDGTPSCPRWKLAQGRAAAYGRALFSRALSQYGCGVSQSFGNTSRNDRPRRADPPPSHRDGAHEFGIRLCCYLLVQVCSVPLVMLWEKEFWQCGQYQAPIRANFLPICGRNAV